MKKIINLLSISLSCTCLSEAETISLPNWWSDRGIIDEDEVSNNTAVANLGQAKWMTTGCYNELDAVIDAELEFSLDSIVAAKPANADAEWYETQRKVLNIGQLKHLSAPFYTRLNELAPQWVETQMELNGISWSENQIFPWDPNTPVEANYAIVNLGQLKSVFSLRFDYDSDGDGNSDLEEYILINQDPDDEFNDIGDVDVIPNGSIDDPIDDPIDDSIDPTHDSDSDGLPDAWELGVFGDLDQDATTDFDGDGLSDGREFELERNPKSEDHPDVILSVSPN